MGSYSEVVAHGHVIQFKTGQDNCDRYQLGQRVAWWVNPDYVYASALLDGVYEGCSGGRLEDSTWQNWWVCIKDHEIVEVARWVPDPEGDWEHLSPHIRQMEELRRKHGIPQSPPRELWTEAAWAQYDENQELLREENQRDAAAGLDAFAQYTRRRMREPGFYRQIMPGYNPPLELTRQDGLVLSVGECYQHFGRPVVLERIYERNLVSVRHLKGTRKIVTAEELTIADQ